MGVIVAGGVVRLALRMDMAALAVGGILCIAGVVIVVRVVVVGRDELGTVEVDLEAVCGTGGVLDDEADGEIFRGGEGLGAGEHAVGQPEAEADQAGAALAGAAARAPAAGGQGLEIVTEQAEDEFAVDQGDLDQAVADVLEDAAVGTLVAVGVFMLVVVFVALGVDMAVLAVEGMIVVAVGLALGVDMTGFAVGGCFGGGGLLGSGRQQQAEREGGEQQGEFHGFEGGLGVDGSGDNPGWPTVL